MTLLMLRYTEQERFCLIFNRLKRIKGTLARAGVTDSNPAINCGVKFLDSTLRWNYFEEVGVGVVFSECGGEGI